MSEPIRFIKLDQAIEYAVKHEARVRVFLCEKENNGLTYFTHNTLGLVGELTIVGDDFYEELRVVSNNGDSKIVDPKKIAKIISLKERGKNQPKPFLYRNPSAREASFTLEPMEKGKNSYRIMRNEVEIAKHVPYCDASRYVSYLCGETNRMPGTKGALGQQLV